MRPFFSASSIMFLPILSLTLRHGSWISSLHAMRAPAPLLILLRKTMGVLPIRSVTLLAMFAPEVGAGALGGASVATAFTLASHATFSPVCLCRCTGCRGDKARMHCFCARACMLFSLSPQHCTGTLLDLYILCHLAVWQDSHALCPGADRHTSAPVSSRALLYRIVQLRDCVAAWAHVPELSCKFCLRGPGVNEQIFGTSTRVRCERALTKSLDGAGCAPSLLNVAPPARVSR